MKKTSYARMSKSPAARRRESVGKALIATTVMLYVLYVFFQLFLFIKREL